MKRKILIAALSTAMLCGSVQVSASSNFFADVPADDWSYTAVNELIATGHVSDYTEPIPQGRIMSRLEMAMIVDAAQQNLSAFTPQEQEVISRLGKEYFYDIKKVRLLNKLDNLDEKTLEQSGEDFTPEEKSKIKALADKFSVGGYVRIRNDHYLKKNRGEDTRRTVRANMIHVQVDSTYKIDDNWQAHLDMGYRNSFSGFDERRNLAFSDNTENDTGFKMDTYLTGKMFDNALALKIGKWNEWNPFGWGMDIDCDFAGAQLTYGKKDFKTFFTAGKMDIWDNFMGGDREHEYVTSLRFFYPFSKKADVNFGVAYTSAMKSRFQDPKHRVFSYYAHGHYKFDDNWDLRVGIINSNAHRDPNNPVAGRATKHPGRWVQLQYKNADLQKPGSYSITADYRYEPALNWVTVTDWCGLNEKFFRLGVSYVPAKNILLNSFYTWGREIDTGARSDLYRFEADWFF